MLIILTTFIEMDYPPSYTINLYSESISLPLVKVFIIGKMFSSIFLNKSSNWCCFLTQQIRCIFCFCTISLNIAILSISAIFSAASVLHVILFIHFYCQLMRLQLTYLKFVLFDCQHH